MRTAVDGSFTLQDLDPDLLFNLLAVAPGHAPAFSYGVDPLLGPISFELEARPSAEGRKDVLRGQVISEDGQPILGASVSATAVIRGETSTYGYIEGLDALAVTDDEGRFVLFGAEPDARYHLAASARARATGFLQGAVPGEDTSFELGIGATISGRLVHAGEPLAGVTMGLVQVDRSSDGWVGDRSISTDEQGRFTFLNVQPKEAHYVYGRLQDLDSVGAVAALEVRSADHGGEVSVGDMTVAAGHSLSGRVEREDGEPIPAGSRLRLSRERAWDSKVIELSPDGQFEFHGLPTERYTMAASVKGHRHSESNWSFDPLNRSGLEGQIASTTDGLLILMEAGERSRTSGFDQDETREFQRRREQQLRGAESRSIQAANYLFVACRDGSLDCLELVAGAPRASVASSALPEPLRFLAMHPTLPIIYALGDEHLFAVQWNQEASTLVSLGKARVGIRGTHVALDPAARWALVASYGDGAVSCLPLSKAGIPGPSVSRLGGQGDARLTKAHQVRWHPSGELAYVPALGADHVAILRVDPTSGALEWSGSAAVPAGTGPRHMALHPSSPWAFVLGELNSTISSFRLADRGATWAALGQNSNLPDGFTQAGSRSSDIHISADGRFLFAVNREPANDLTAYAIDENGSLRELSRSSTGGDHARTFALDPLGDRLWIGNTNSKTIVTLSIALDGTLGTVAGFWPAPGDVSCVLAR
ncbi:MAG: 6-phosphogluconolactonase [Planctomycetota bacterium]